MTSTDDQAHAAATVEATRTDWKALARRWERRAKDADNAKRIIEAERDQLAAVAEARAFADTRATFLAEHYLSETDDGFLFHQGNQAEWERIASRLTPAGPIPLGGSDMTQLLQPVMPPPRSAWQLGDETENRGLADKLLTA